MGSNSKTLKRLNRYRDKGAQKKSTKSRSSTRAKRRRTRRTMSSTRTPVMVRAPGNGTVRSSAKSSKRAKRRFYVALNTPGAEMRLPSIPVVQAGWRWVSLAMTGLLLFMVYFALTSPTFRVDAADIYGLKRLSDMKVYTTLDISGEPIFTLDTANLEEALSTQFPEFSSVNVEIGMPNTVAISVTERVPVLAWIQNGTSQLVDSEGMAFPLRSDGPKYTTPVVEASSAPPVPRTFSIESVEQELEGAQAPSEEEEQAENAPFITQGMVSAVLTLAKFAPEDTPLLYDGLHGLGWKDPRGWDVYFGTADEIDVKLQVYGAVVGRLLADGIQPALISVEYPHAPFYRMER